MHTRRLNEDLTCAYVPPFGNFFLFFSFISLIADGPHHYHPACGHKGSSHLSPVHALQFFLSRCKFSTLTTRQPLVEFYLLTFPRFPLRKKEHKSYFGKNRTHDFRTSRCAAYLLDHSGDCETKIVVGQTISPFVSPKPLAPPALVIQTIEPDERLPGAVEGPTVTDAGPVATEPDGAVRALIGSAPSAPSVAEEQPAESGIVEDDEQQQDGDKSEENSSEAEPAGEQDPAGADEPEIDVAAMEESSSPKEMVPSAEGVPDHGRSAVYLSPGSLLICLSVLSVCVSLGVFFSHAPRSS